MMWELIKDLLLVSLGMDIGVGKEADYGMKKLEESEDN